MSTTLLRKAIQSADPAQVEAALASCDASTLWPGGTSALLWALFEASEAAQAGNAGRRAALRRIAGRLLEAGAPLNAAAADGTTALHLAVLTNDAPFVERLLAAGACADPPNAAAHQTRRAPPLVLAAQRGHTIIVERLLARGADLERCGPDGRAAFAVALAAGHTATAVRLARGADGRPRPGTLASAAADGALAAVQALVAAGAELNPGGPLSPMELALRNGHAQVAQWLAAQGARGAPAVLGLAFNPGTEPVVANVLVGSAADQAQMRRGDRVIALSSTAITSVADLQRVLGDCLAGQRVRLQWRRGPQRCEADVELLAAAAAPPLKYSDELSLRPLVSG